MHIVPDLLGTVDPDVDLQVLVEDGIVDPGVYLKPQQVRPPRFIFVRID